MNPNAEIIWQEKDIEKHIEKLAQIAQKLNIKDGVYLTQIGERNLNEYVIGSIKSEIIVYFNNVAQTHSVGLLKMEKSLTDTMNDQLDLFEKIINKYDLQFTTFDKFEIKKHIEGISFAIKGQMNMLLTQNIDKLVQEHNEKLKKEINLKAQKEFLKQVQKSQKGKK